jgi:hypothetical protein
MEQVAPFPSKEELKMRFQAWYKSRAESLKVIFLQEINGETLCKKWQQLRKKDPEHIIIHLVGHVSVAGTGHLLGVDLEGISLTMTILVINGYVDRLCDSKT